MPKPTNASHAQSAPSQQTDVAIIGAGAAGLFAAQLIGKAGKSVVVLDHANKAGKKILMSGGGRCNFTNLVVSPQHFVSRNPHFVRSALAKFTPDHFLAYIYQHGIEFEEREHGQLFCTNSAGDIVNMLLNECQSAGVQLRLNSAITGIEHVQTDFYIHVQPKQGAAYRLIAKQLIIATGGLSIPTMGASGLGYQLASQFGHHIIPTAASLVPFTFTDDLGAMIKSLAGLAMPVGAFNARIRFNLPMLFTHRGLSGPAMLQLSNYWQLGEAIHIDLLPDMDAADWLLSQKSEHPKQRIRSVLAPFFAKKLLSALEDRLWADVADKPLADIKDQMLCRLGKTLNDWCIKPAGTEGYRVAEVTLGGVDTKDVSSKTMESQLVPKLYFIGEVLDVTGWLGGYNFQWAWASAAACAHTIIQD